MSPHLDADIASTSSPEQHEGIWVPARQVRGNDVVRAVGKQPENGHALKAVAQTRI